MSSLVIPAGFVGNVVSQDATEFVFNTVDATGLPVTLTGGAVQVRNLSLNGTSTTGVSLTTDVVTGMHRVSIDTTDQSVWQRGYDFAIELTAGTVGAIAVTGVVVGSLTVAGKSGGKLYDQAVKVYAGSVTAVDGGQPARVFTGTFSGASQVSDQYKAQVISFQPKKDGTGSANQGVGRAVLTSVGAGTDLVTFTCQDDFFSPISIGDEFKILPEERSLTVYTANITAEWGGNDPSPKDQYTIWWSANGSVIQNPANVITQMQFQVWRRVYPGADVEIINEVLTADTNSGVYSWDETGNFIAENQGALMLATALIDDIPVSFPRVLFNYV